MSVKEAVLLEGKVLAAKIQNNIKENIAGFAAKGLPQPRMISIQAGDDRASDWYIGQQEKMAAKLGIAFERAAAADQKSLLEKIQDANQKFDGIFLAMPLPKGFNSDEALFAMNPQKDVEGIHPTSLGLMVLRKSKLIPPTAYAALLLMEYAVQDAGKTIRGMNVTVAGQSAIVGRPLQLLLGERRATTIVCNTGTSTADLEKYVSESDIVVACAGQPGLIKGQWVKNGAIVIDVGTTEIKGKLVGDVDFEEAKKRASYITPVPGGVGPLTVTMLMQNLIHAYKWQKGIA